MADGNGPEIPPQQQQKIVAAPHHEIQTPASHGEMPGVKGNPNGGVSLHLSPASPGVFPKDVIKEAGKILKGGPKKVLPNILSLSEAHKHFADAVKGFNVSKEKFLPLANRAGELFAKAHKSGKAEAETLETEMKTAEDAYRALEAEMKKAGINDPVVWWKAKELLKQVMDNPKAADVRQKIGTTPEQQAALKRAEKAIRDLNAKFLELAKHPPKMPNAFSFSGGVQEVEKLAMDGSAKDPAQVAAAARELTQIEGLSLGTMDRVYNDFFQAFLKVVYVSHGAPVREGLDNIRVELERALGAETAIDGPIAKMVLQRYATLEKIISDYLRNSKGIEVPATLKSTTAMR